MYELDQIIELARMAHEAAMSELEAFGSYDAFEEHSPTLEEQDIEYAELMAVTMGGI